MSLKHSALSTLMILFSCSAMADDALLKSIEANNHLIDSMSKFDSPSSLPGQQGFAGHDCYGSTSRPFSGSGMSAGHGSTDCYVTEYDLGDSNVKTYYHSDPYGSYGVGFSWSFE
ncbi:hypothetical protein SE23_07005 [Vibrio sinaloensis]|uniref:hypothetical protein n=1 Tax=Photobacterium sp. (strain ATCC 43367) TaxID=379097 RepID=UPI00057FE961|nr:hypothetical protein [Vibrio sinaloensis]KIE21949.1 hypothetical protein SE23_07005 [Vibrio sinaloensis]